MKNNKRLVVYIIEILVGVGLVICGFAGFMDEYWSGMGTMLILIGALRLVRYIKYRTDESYRETMDVQTNDERNRYLSTKAWSCAGYLFVMIAAIGSIVLKIVGLEEYMMMASGSVCLIMVLYWLSYLCLRKKY